MIKGKDSLPSTFTDCFISFSHLACEILNLQEISFSWTEGMITYFHHSGMISDGISDKAIDPFPVPNEYFPEAKVLSRKLDPYRERKIMNLLIKNFEHEIKIVQSLETEISRMNTMIEQSPLSIQISYPDGRLKSLNPAWRRLWQVTDIEKEKKFLKEYNIFKDPLLQNTNTLELIKKGFKGEVTHIPVLKYEPALFGSTARSRYIEALVYPIKDNRGNIIEVVLIHIDVTEKEELLEKLREERNHLESIVEFLPVGILFLNKDSYQFSLANQEMTRIQGRSVKGLVWGKDYIPIAYHPDGKVIRYSEWPGIRALEKGERVLDEQILFKSDRAKTTYLSSSAVPIKDDKGDIKGSLIVASDITRFKRLEKSSLFLSNLTSFLIETLDYQGTIFKIADSCVPLFADGCVIDVIENKVISRLVTRHFSPEVEKVMQRIVGHMPGTEVIETCEPLLIEHFEERYPIHGIQLRSLIAVPLMSHGHCIGSIRLLITSERDCFDKMDLETAIELARRASLAIVNSRLYHTAQDAIKLRDEFISVASHELKTPITSMKLQLQLAEKMLQKDSSLPLHIDYFKNALSLSYKQLNRINILVNDMLDVTRISNRKFEMSMSQQDLTLIVKELIQRLNYQFEDLQQKLKCHLEDNLPILCDNFRIEQVITNLISNAVKYGEGNPIELTLSRSGNEAILQVKDYGLGIEGKDQERIFERFERAVSLKHISGLGLGLFISKKIIEQHKGKLSLVSRLGEGSTFTVRLPLIN